MSLTHAKEAKASAALTDFFEAAPAPDEPDPPVCVVCGTVDAPGHAGTHCPDCWEQTDDGWTEPDDAPTLFDLAGSA